MKCDHDAMDGLGLGPDLWWCWDCGHVVAVDTWREGSLTLATTRHATYEELTDAITKLREEVMSKQTGTDGEALMRPTPTEVPT